MGSVEEGVRALEEVSNDSDEEEAASSDRCLFMGGVSKSEESAAGRFRERIVEGPGPAEGAGGSGGDGNVDVEGKAMGGVEGVGEAR